MRRSEEDADVKKDPVIKLSSRKDTLKRLRSVDNSEIVERCFYENLLKRLHLDIDDGNDHYSSVTGIATVLMYSIDHMMDSAREEICKKMRGFIWAIAYDNSVVEDILEFFVRLVEVDTPEVVDWVMR